MRVPPLFRVGPSHSAGAPLKFQFLDLRRPDYRPALLIGVVSCLTYSNLLTQYEYNNNLTCRNIPRAATLNLLRTCQRFAPYAFSERQISYGRKAIARSSGTNQRIPTVGEKSYLAVNAARYDLFAYIEGYYNRQRLHSALEYITPNKPCARPFDPVSTKMGQGQ